MPATTVFPAIVPPMIVADDRVVPLKVPELLTVPNSVPPVTVPRLLRVPLVCEIVPALDQRLPDRVAEPPAIRIRPVLEIVAPWLAELKVSAPPVVTLIVP